MNAPARLVVTRPQPDADRWVAQLRELGCEAQALPLLDIGPVAGSMKLQQTVESVGQYNAVMWVSGNAVTRFFARRHAPWPSGTRCWAPGPGTAQMLRGAGVPADLVDSPLADVGQYDSEALWQVIGSQVRRGVRILLVRGRTQHEADAGQGNGRDWLLERCRAAGALVDVVAIYERRLPEWDDAARAAARLLTGPGHTWLFSSSEAAANLPRLLPGTDWRVVPALATHPRVAEALRAVGFQHLQVCRPTPRDVAAALLHTPSP